MRMPGAPAGGAKSARSRFSKCSKFPMPAARALSGENCSASRRTSDPKNRVRQLLRDGKDLAQLPERSVGRFGRPLFQGLSYHDTPDKLLPLQYIDRTAVAGTRYEYRVLTINSVGLRSAPTKALMK